MSNYDALLQVPSSAAIRLAELTASDADDRLNVWRRAGLLSVRVRGRRMRSTDGLMAEMSAALQFPHYFGENWAALDECLSDMDWLLPTKAIVVLVGEPSDVLRDEPIDELQALVKAISNASETYNSPIAEGEWWDRPAVPFHIVLQTDPGTAGEVIEWWSSAGAQPVPLAL